MIWSLNTERVTTISDKINLELLKVDPLGRAADYLLLGVLNNYNLKYIISEKSFA